MSKPPGFNYSPDELSNIWADLRGEGQHKCQDCGHWYDDDVMVCPDCDELYEQENN